MLIGLQGSIAVAGTAFDKVPGDSMDQKLNALYLMEFKRVLELITSDGFLYHLQEGAAVAVPNKYLIMTVCDKKKLAGNQ